MILHARREVFKSIESIVDNMIVADSKMHVSWLLGCFSSMGERRASLVIGNFYSLLPYRDHPFKQPWQNNVCNGQS